jgi:hypothetical protein
MLTALPTADYDMRSFGSERLRAIADAYLEKAEKA